MNCDVLVLNADTRAALAAIRSLGRANLRVSAASHIAAAIGLVSRHCHYQFLYPDPAKETEKFREWLLNTCIEIKPQLLIPCSDLSVEIVSEMRERLNPICALPLGPHKQVNKVLSKHNLLHFASHLGVRCPQTLFIPQKDQRKHNPEVRQLDFPCVVKTDVSFSENSSGNFDKFPVYYPNSFEELEAILSRMEVPLLIQEQVRGVGVGVFALCKNGETYSLFAHERILEKPPSGGRSVLSKSIALDSAPVEQARKLLKELEWTGPAMVEFKRDVQGHYYLMEINPRFWGTLQLSISAGVNFPFQLFELLGKQATVLPSTKYTNGIRLRWLLGTLDHLFINFKMNPSKTLGDLIFRNSLQLFKAKTCYDVFQLSDPRPFLRELSNYLRPHE